VTPERPKNEKTQKPLVNAFFIAPLESRERDAMTISIGVAIANLAKASVIGGISVRASLMKRKEAAQRQTIVPANVKGIRVLFVVGYLPVLSVLLVQDAKCYALSPCSSNSAARHHPNFDSSNFLSHQPHIMAETSSQQSRC
jgi:hypothetical protein